MNAISTPMSPQQLAWREQEAFNARLLESGSRMAPAGAVSHERIRTQRRDGGEGRPAPPRLDAGVDRQISGPSGPIPVRVFATEGATATYLHFHGGGWVFGSPAEYDELLVDVARHAGICVMSVDYRLAPEHPHPAAVDDAEAAALWLLEHANDELGTTRLLMGGESAGAHVAVMALLQLRDRHHLAGAISAVQLSYGIYDLGMTASQKAWGDRMLVLSTPWLEWFYEQVTPGLDARQRRSPTISPLYADLSGLPPALFSVGTADPLLDDTLQMGAAWQLAGNEACLAVHPGAAHGMNVHPTTVGLMARRQIHDFLAGHAKDDEAVALGVADAWRQAVEANDMEAFARLYHPEADVWTSIERRSRPLAEHLALVTAARAACEEWAYEDVRYQATAEGFVGQHSVRLRSRGAERHTVAAVVGTVRNGRITHLDEYFNRTVESLT